MKAGLGAMRNKTDRNDARALPNSFVLAGSAPSLSKATKLNAPACCWSVAATFWASPRHRELHRGSLKVFGLRIGAVTKRGFEGRVLELVAGYQSLIAIVKPLLRARRAIIDAFERLDQLCIQLARRDPICRRSMTVPGVGVIVALTYVTGVDAPERFKRSRDVGAHFGLTPRRYSSGQIDYDGRISRCGDEMVRTALYQAAHVLMHHGRWSALRSWAMRIAKRRSVKSAKVALARKLAVVMHRMWSDGTDFRWSDPQTPDAPAAAA